jgi:formylglycine-generating enzyme required for sulfatase activity
MKIHTSFLVVAVLFFAFAAPSLHAQLIEARAYWRGGGSVPGFLDGGGVAFDADGNLFRTQINQDLTVAEGLILKITPDGVYTSIPFPYFQPYTLALTDTGNIYVGSWFNEVAKIAPDGSVTRMYTQGSAMGMAADANGNVWVGSTGGIFRISPNDDIEVFGSFFIDGANGMAVDEDGWLYFQTSVSYPGGGFAAWPDLTLTPTTVVTGTDYLGNQQGFTFRGSVSAHPLVPNANSGDVGQRAFYTVPEPSTYALLLMTAAGALWFTRKRRPIKVRPLIPVVAELFAALTSHNLQAQPLVNIETVTIGDPGNAADTTGYGAVANVFAIGKYEVTIGQYTTFLNAVAATDPYALYNPSMATDLNVAGISRSGASGSYTYAVVNNGGDSSNRPITYVSWFDAARFCNWLHNGATNGASTETGAYTLNGASSGIIAKNPGATWWIPSEDEWFKAAYYKGGGTNAGYWLYPTESDSAPGNTIGGAANQANYYAGDFAVTQSANYSATLNYLTDAGVFGNSTSAYDTYDQGGNVYEWNDGVVGSSRGVRGGNWGSGVEALPSSYRAINDVPSSEFAVGFRAASGARTPSVVLTAEKTTSLLGQWEFAPITADMITPAGELNVGPMTNTDEFYRLKIRTVVE